MDTSRPASTDETNTGSPVTEVAATATAATADDIAEESPLTEVAATAPDAAATADGMDENPLENGGGDGSGGGGGGEADVGRESGSTETEATLARKRGRPRKYQADENATLPAQPYLSASWTKLAQKRGRGRPRGSGKLQFLESLGGFAAESAGENFIPYALTIQIGQNIVDKIWSFAQRGPRCICILSASGCVSCVDILQPGSSGNTLRYEGQFDILTLTGSHTFHERGGLCRKIGMLSVSLANPDGRVFGGAVAGSLIAAGPIQLILASFRQNIKKQLQMKQNTESSTAAGVFVKSDTVTPSNPNCRTRDVEENCSMPTSLLPETPNEKVQSIFGEQNMNHVCIQSVDGNGLLSSEPMSEQYA